jgi:hypothetical protein
LAAAFRGGGQSDWFLPSIGELFALYQSGVSGMTSGVYWSSSQQNANGWRLSFSGNGNLPLTAAKTVESRVRAIRAFAEPSAAAVNTSLNGVWVSSAGHTVRFDGNAGYLTAYTGSGTSQQYISNGTFKLGDSNFRNITAQGNLRWTGQRLAFRTNPPPYETSWQNTTITMSSDGQTIQVATSNVSGSETFTRQR